MRRGGRPASAASRSTCSTCSAAKWRRWPRTRARTSNARGIGSDGSLYYLSRPHTGTQRSFFGTIKEIVLIPARLLYALFQYLNFFSARYTGKPLTAAGGPKGQSGDLRRMLQWANLVDAQSEGAPSDETGGVPAAHRLMRRRSGTAEALASGVVCYDLASDGSILYATGAAIFRLDPGGRAERLCAASAVHTLVAL